MSSFAQVKQNASFRLLEEPGPHAVGLKVVEQYDRERVFRSSADEAGKPIQGERARPLQTLVWYPAKKSNQRAMEIGDYLALMETETSFDKPE
jgi:hypothetical protein